MQNEDSFDSVCTSVSDNISIFAFGAKFVMLLITMLSHATLDT